MDHIGKQLEKIERNIELVTNDPIALHGFTQVPNFLFKNSGLTMGAIVVYAKFLSYAWHNDYCFPGQQRLADDLDMGIASINRFIKELEDSVIAHPSPRSGQVAGAPGAGVRTARRLVSGLCPAMRPVATMEQRSA